MTSIKSSSPNPSPSTTENGPKYQPKLAPREPPIQRHNEEQLNDGGREEPGITGLDEPQGFLGRLAPMISRSRDVINGPRYTFGAVVAGVTATKDARGANMPKFSKFMQAYFSPYNMSFRVLDLPLRVITTANAMKNQNAGDATANGTKLGATVGEVVVDVVTTKMLKNKGIPYIPFERGHPLRTNQAPSVEKVPTTPSRLPPDAPASQPAFVRGDPSRTPVRARPSSPPPQPPASQSSFVRGSPSRTPVRAPPSTPPRLPAPSIHPPSSAVPTSGIGTVLPRVGLGFGVIGGAMDIYFGVKQARNDHEPAGKAQGGLFAAAGVTGVASSAAGLASTAGVAGAGVAATALGAASLALAAVGTGMAAVPAIHARDNKNRGIKLSNDVTHEVKQMEGTEAQLSHRANVQLKPTLNALHDRYGIQPKTVWLNNNSADYLNQVNSPNNTASGQWKPDNDGNVWSNFRDKYIRIGGAPHQDKVALNLPAEKNGSGAVLAGVETSVTVPGDKDPEKTPTQLNSLAAEPGRYEDEGWSGSTGQPLVTKNYGYQTSGWGQHWETNIPFSVNAGPFYISHPVFEQGEGTVVLIDDTPVERPDKPVPKKGYTEGALFAHDGKDGERLTAKQVVEIAWRGKPATIGDKFNVAESATKQEENAYREAAYPVKEGTTYIRTPDRFSREIVTQPAHRTVVSLQNISNPVRVVMQNERDIIDIPSAPRADVHISLPPLPAGADDQRRLGIPDQQAKPTFYSQQVFDGPDGKGALYSNTYALANGGTITVVADDISRIERFIGAS